MALAELRGPQWVCNDEAFDRGHSGTRKGRVFQYDKDDLMKRFAIVFVLSAFSLFACAAFAQENGASDQDQSQQGMQGQHKHGKRSGHQPDPQKRVKRMTKQLKLSSDQQSKILDILQDQQKQFESLRSDTSSSQEERHSKMMDLRKSTDDQIRGVLNPDQQKKFDQMLAKREQRMQGRHGHKNQQNQNSTQQPQ